VFTAREAAYKRAQNAINFTDRNVGYSGWVPVIYLLSLISIRNDMIGLVDQGHTGALVPLKKILFRLAYGT